MEHFSIVDWMRGYYSLGGIDLMISAAKEKVLTGKTIPLRSQQELETALKSISPKEMFTLVANEYINKIINEFREKKHPGKKKSLYVDKNGKRTEILQAFSALDKAIIMTYEKYKDGAKGYTPLQITSRCLTDLFYNSDNHFTRSVDNNNISALEYANCFITDMKMVSNDWKTAAYMQMAQDVCLNLANSFSHQKEIQDVADSQIRIKKFFPSVFNRVRENMASGKINGVNRRVNGNLPGMYYAQDIGNVRSNQEDALLIKEHPSIKGLRIAIVSDGMGGGEKGEEASHITVTELKKWFEELKIDPNKVDTGTLRMNLAKKIKEISGKIIASYGSHCGATLTGAIIGNKDALVLNLGDSRTYLVKNGQLEQVTRDHSAAQESYEKYFRNVYPGMQPDEMRFWRKSNVINRYLGIDVEHCTPDFFHLNKEDYDRLILCSDGVSDCLSFKQIATFAKTLSKKDLANALVNGALMNESKNTRKIEGFDSKVTAGKDNATAVVVDR